MTIANNFIELIGNTPLIKLKKASEMTGCTILGKAEFLNPGGSVKDRAAKAIILDAQEKGLLRPGGTIVEGTAGNTGISLSLIANACGYKSVIVMPETQSQEKKDALRLFGAQLHLVPAVPYSNPDHYVHTSERLAATIAKDSEHGAIWANQFDNLANRHGHATTTGPEIWNQTNGTVDGFTCAVGSGGTLGGVCDYLKQQNPNIVIAASDPLGSAMYGFFNGGEKIEGGSISEGIGQSRITANLENALIDTAFQIRDEDALPIIFDLLKNEGICLGGSSAINIAGAIELAKQLGPGKTIVTILCDSGTRYQSKLYNIDFLKSKNLPTPDWL